MKILLLFTLIFVNCLNGYAQIAINATGANAHPSSMLDVQSTSKGMLIPRMTTSQLNSIENPAQGLLVFVSDSNDFYYYKNNKWIKIGTGAAGWYKNSNYIFTDDSVAIGTAIPKAPLEVHGLISETGTGKSVFLGDSAGFENDVSSSTYNVGIGYKTLTYSTTGKYNTAIGNYALFSNGTGNKNTAVGVSVLNLSQDVDENTAVGRNALGTNISGTNNTALGFSSLCFNISGESNTAMGDSSLYHNNGNYNTAMGYNSLMENNTGTNNVALGYNTLKKNTGGNYNTAIGSNSLLNNVGGKENTSFGDWSLKNNTSGNNNTALGNEALMKNSTGKENTAIGNMAGHELESGDQNVFIGNNAGYYETGSQKLYIDNSPTAKPLIGGDFSTDKIYVNGKVGIGTSSPNELLEVADTNSTGSYSARMIVSDGHGSARRALLFVSPNSNGSNNNARIESFNYGAWQGCNLEFNRIGEGKTMFYGDTYFDKTIKLGSYSKGNHPLQAGMIRWNELINDFEGYDGEKWVSLTKQNSWGRKISIYPEAGSIASDGDTNNLFGWSVSVSNNNYAFVGAKNKKVNGGKETGGIYIFQYNNSSGWTEIKNFDGDLEYDHLGYSVSNNNNNALAGAPTGWYNGARTGYVKVYEYSASNGGWIPYLTLHGSEAGSDFGFSVSVNGNYGLIGSPGKAQGEGSVYVFDFSNNTIQYQISNPSPQSTNSFGYYVSLSGYYAAIYSSEKTYIYKRVESGNDTTWVLKDSLNVSGPLSIDNDYVVVIKSNDTAVVYHRTNETWILQDFLLSSNSSGNNGFCFSGVSIFGNYIAIGAKVDNSSGGEGAVYIFHRSDFYWNMENILTNFNSTENDFFGQGVSITNNHLVVGAPYREVNGKENQGKIYFSHYY